MNTYASCLLYNKAYEILLLLLSINQNFKQRQAIENKEIKKQQEQVLLGHYMKIRDEALKEQQEKKATILKEGRMLQQFHRSQMVNILANFVLYLYYIK
jgi:16S rRNA C1402 (ribose-2'-O) methylase RsmI